MTVGTGSGRALGSRYQLVDRLGEGAMGEVWRAHDRTTGTFRAAKLLKGSFAADHTIVGRFVQERSILVALDHPNIVKVHDLVVEGDDLAIVMDLVEGPDLRSYLRSRGTLAPREAVTITCAILDALAAAHARGCLHRDVKPDNVLLASADAPTAADVRLTDFSIARLAQESTVQSTGLLGTPGYMPPELFTDGRFGAASDLYATGILLYELLAGRTPFAGSGTAHTVGFRHVQMAPPQIPVPAELWHVLSTMLAKDPALRLGIAATATALRELPAGVLDAPALPVQPVPDDWHSAVHTAVAGRPIRVEVLDADLDVGATNLHDQARSTGHVVADVGEVQALAPRVDSLHGETQLGFVREGPVTPVLTPEVTSEPPRKRAVWPWAVGSVVLVGALVGVLFATGVLGGSGDAAPDQAQTSAAVEGGGPTTVEAESEDPALDSGLTITREATWLPDQGAVDLTVEFSSAGAPLTGPFLVVFPRPDGEDCPLAGFAEDSGAVEIYSADLAGERCGWAVPGELEDGDSLQVTANVPLELPAEDPEPALQDWLDQIGKRTQKVAESIRSGTDFAAQRLLGISLTVRESTLQVRERLQYAVYPVWAGNVEVTDPIFVLEESNGSSRVISQVAGGPEGFDVSAADCRALQRSPGFRFEAVEQGSCVVTATIGRFTADADVTVTPDS